MINDKLIIRANKHAGSEYHNIVIISLDDHHSTMSRDTPPCAGNLASHHRMNFCDGDLSLSD